MTKTENAYDREDLRQALDCLRCGGIILYPTDTVWGLGCDATNSEAVSRIYRIKERNDSKALITLVDSPAMLERTVDTVPEVAWQLIDVAVDPMTIVYDRGTGVASELLAPDGSIGVRVCSRGFAAELCRQLRRPLVSTSANKSGTPTPLSFAEISDEIRQAADYVCTSGRDDAPAAKASTVIKLGNDCTVKILRK